MESEQQNSTTESFSEIPIVGPVVCSLVRFRSMALVNEVRETGTDKKLLVYGTNGGIRMGKGTQVWWQHIRRRQGKVERGEDSMEGGTHSELMPNIFAMKPV